MTARRRIARAVVVLLVGLATVLAGPDAVALAEAPELTISTPAAGWTNDPTPSFIGATSDSADPVTLEIYTGAGVQGIPLQKLISLPLLEKWKTSPEPALAQGQYTAVAEQTNILKETGSSAPVTFTVDTRRPVVSILPPLSPGRDSTPTLNGGAGADSGDRATVTVTIYSGESAEGPIAVPAHLVTVSGTGWSYSTPHLADGTYTARVLQGDEAGNTGVAETQFTIDASTPEVAITEPTADAILGSSTPTFSGDPGQAVGDLPSVTLKIFAGGSPSGSPLQELELIAVGARWTSGAIAAPLADGVYTAIAEQSDEAGNTGRSRVTFAVSQATSSPPVTAASSISHPVASFRWFPSAPHVGEPVSLVSNSTDLSSPINGFAWDLTGSGAFVGGSSIMTTSFSTAGAHLVRLHVTDANGLSSVATQTIVVTAAPLVLMRPFPVVRIAGTETTTGARISLLTVQAPVGSRVHVSCRGRGCPAKPVQLVSASQPKKSSTGMVMIEFRRFERSLRAGAVLEIRVSRPGEIGKYTRLRVRRGRLPARLDSCLAPAGIKPIACPSG